MLEIAIPGREQLQLEHLVLDFNGTLAVDGELLPGVPDALAELAQRLRIHVITGDTFGSARSALADLPCELTVLPTHDQASAKLSFVEQLSPARCVCIGNGANDVAMLEAAALSIVVVQGEGAAMDALLAAKVVAPSIASALSLLIEPLRLIATLRS